VPKLTQDELSLRAGEMLSPILFFKQGEAAPCLWGCAQCGTVHAHEINAVKCYTCYPSLCKTEGCGTRLEPRSCYNVCKPCKEQIDAKKLAEVVAKAKTRLRFKDYEDDEFFSPDGDFYYDLSALDDYVCERTYPRFVFGVTKVKIQVDADSILENAFENLAVDADPEHFILARKEFEEACKAFNDAQTQVCFHEDCSIVVFLDWPDPKTFGHEEGDVHEDWPEKWDVEKVMAGEERCL